MMAIKGQTILADIARLLIKYKMGNSSPKDAERIEELIDDGNRYLSHIGVIYQEDLSGVSRELMNLRDQHWGNRDSVDSTIKILVDVLKDLQSKKIKMKN